jgi:predicted cupin superfamily sugar epimerase
MDDKETIINNFDLKPLEGEGGFFRRTYCSSESVKAVTLSGKSVQRPKSTSILFLVGGEDFSALHKLEFDEFYHFSDGNSCELFLIDNTGKSHKIILGKDISKGHVLQFMVPAGWLQGLRSLGEWSLVGTTMSPGFDFDDFSLPTQKELLEIYPNLKKEILRFTRC